MTGPPAEACSPVGPHRAGLCDPVGGGWV